MASRSPKLFCNTSVSSLQWALVSTLFSHTHFRAFLAVMADVIKQINTTIPDLKTVSFRQDSAGCYHCRACRATIVCAGVLGAELGVVFKLLAPFPPHGRKGACDRKAGGYICPPKLRTRYQDPGGEPSLSVIRCASIASRLVTTWKIDGVNIQFSKERIRPCMKSIWRGTYKTNNCAEI